MPSKNKPFFSIIVPAYNVEDYIAECIASVLIQSLSDFELILVDDGSTDKTGAICDQYQKNRDQHDKNLPHTTIVAQIDEKVNSKSAPATIKVIHQPNAGLSAARNSGVDQARGEYLIFLDGDDYLEPDALAVIKQGIEPGLDLLRYQAQEVFPNGKTIRHDEMSFDTMSGAQAFPKLAQQHYTENAWLYAYRREFFVAHHFRYADGRLAEDFGLTPLIIAKAKRVKAISDICYDYRQRDGSLMHDPSKIRPGVSDMFSQLEVILPQIAAIPNTEPILHYLVVSFLTESAQLSHADFLQVYQRAKQAQLLQYIHPTSLKAWPRSFLLQHFPQCFYRLYRS